MPAYDQCHDQVVRALQKDGWRIISVQVRVAAGKRRVFIDVLAERTVNGRRQRIMLVEIKCFPNDEDTTQELYISIGQYVVYRAMLEENEELLPLYLAIPEHIFDKIFDAPILRAFRSTGIKLVVVNLETETVREWIE